MLSDLASAIQVTGATTGIDPMSGSFPLRQEINLFSSSGPTWDLFIQAFQQFKTTNSNDTLSFYQIAGIHGYPRQPWDGVVGTGGGGFCHHGSVLFPIWHRPYLALYEVSYPVEKTMSNG